MITKEELDNRFTYHSPKTGQAELYQDLREKGKELASLIISTVPEGREQALALTNVEQAIFWANAGIARQ